MSPRPTRRALLRATGSAAAVGVAGCGGLDGDTASETPAARSYGIVVHNRMRQSDFESSQRLQDPKPAMVALTVRDLDPNTDRAYLETTVEVPLEASKTVEDAFTAQPDGTTYAMTARAEPYSQQDAQNTNNLEDSRSFTRQEAPAADPIPVVVTTANRGEPTRMWAEVTIREQPGDG